MCRARAVHVPCRARAVPCHGTMVCLVQVARQPLHCSNIEAFNHIHTLWATESQCDSVTQKKNRLSKICYLIPTLDLINQKYLLIVMLVKFDNKVVSHGAPSFLSVSLLSLIIYLFSKFMKWFICKILLFFLVLVSCICWSIMPYLYELWSMNARTY